MKFCMDSNDRPIFQQINGTHTLRFLSFPGFYIWSISEKASISTFSEPKLFKPSDQSGACPGPETASTPWMVYEVRRLKFVAVFELF